jgi:outer membrane protein OmpA-like peptidoglycan-associated protein
MKCHPERWVWGLIPIAMLSWIAVDAEADRIERDLERRSSRALAAAGFDWASIAFSGRDGLLVGTPHGPRERAEALAVVRGVWGVRKVIGRTRSREVLAAVDVSSVKGRHLPPQEVLAQSAVAPLTATLALPVVAADPSSLREVGPPATGSSSPVAASRPPSAPPLPHVLSAAELAASALHPDPSAHFEQLRASDVLAPAATARVPPHVEVVKARDVSGLEGAAAADGPSRHFDLVEAYDAAAAKASEVGVAHIERPSGAANGADGLLASRGLTPPAQRSDNPAVSIATAALARSVALAADQCRIATDEIRVFEPIRFKSDSAALDARRRAELDRIAAAANACPSARLQISGHADASGPDRHNMALSLRRANRVAGYLITKGIDAVRLKAVGYGETRPIAPNDTEDNRARNRRIEVEVTGLGNEESPAEPAGKGTDDGLSDR